MHAYTLGCLHTLTCLEWLSDRHAHTQARPHTHPHAIANAHALPPSGSAGHLRRGIEHDEVGLPPVVIHIGEEGCKAGHVHYLSIPLQPRHEGCLSQCALPMSKTRMSAIAFSFDWPQQTFNAMQSSPKQMRPCRWSAIRSGQHLQEHVKAVQSRCAALFYRCWIVDKHISHPVLLALHICAPRSINEEKKASTPHTPRNKASHPGLMPQRDTNAALNNP